MEHNRFSLAPKDSEAHEQLIVRYKPFIRRCASRACGHYVDEHDDLYSEALLAFDMAIAAYDKVKGDFLPFASKVIQNRIIDYKRRESRYSSEVPFCSLATQNDHGDEMCFDAEDTDSPFSDGLIEVLSLRQELSRYGISVFDLPSATPKAEKTKAACKRIICYVQSQPALCETILCSGVFPAKHLTQVLGVPKKTFERHKRYILAGLLICEHGYPLMQQYFR